MESQRLSLMLTLLFLSSAGAAPLLAEGPGLRPVETPPLLLETGEPLLPENSVHSEKIEPAPNNLPVWVGDRAEVIGNAFEFEGEEKTDSLLRSESSAFDIGKLLSPSTETNDGVPVPTTAFLTQLAQLERAASEASNPHTLGRLATAAERLATRPALSDSDRQQAEELASWAYAARGRHFSANGKRKAALEDFDRAVRLSPASASARLDRAISLAELGESERALRDFDQVLAQAPNWTVARRNRAGLLLGLGEDERALQDCDRAIRSLHQQKFDTDRVPLLTLRGRILHRLGHHKEAIADYDHALRLQTGDSVLHLLRGNAFAEIGFYEQAANDYLQAVRADPEFAEAYRCLAWLLATCPEKRIRNPATAIEAAWRARRLGPPGDPMMLDASAAAYASAGNFAEAVRWEQRALVAANSSSALRFHSRLELYQSGQSYRSPVVAMKVPANRGRVLPATHEKSSKPGALRPLLP